MKGKIKRTLAVLSTIAMTIGAIPATKLQSFAENTAASAVLYGDINGDSAINSTDTTELTKAINNKTASSLKNADLNGDGKVNNSDALILKQYVSGEIKYFPVGDVYEAGVTFVTRGEWIHNLVTTFNMSVDDTSTIQNYYTDLSGNQYANDIELAANFGVFEVECNTFSPDSMVTREFAAHTANFCVGYLNEGSANFADTDDIYYEDDAVVSVEKGWFALVESQFRPELYMRSTESTAIIKDLNTVISVASINEKAKQTVEYSDSVIQLDSSVKAEQTGDTVTINDEDVAIVDGDVFVVNIDGTDHMYKANSVSIGKSGEIIAKVEDAPLEESLSNVDIQGYGEVDYNNITYYDNTAAVQTYSDTQNITLPNDYFYAAKESNSVSLSKTIDLGGNKITISGSISNIRPEYKLQYDGKKVESFYLNVNADANLTAKTSGSFSSTKSKEVRIASVPVVCGGALTANVAVYVTVSLSGEITVSYGWDIAGGVSYTANGGWRTTKNFHKKSFTLDAKTSESVAVKAAIEARFATIKVAELYAMAGEKGNTEAKKREDGTECCTLKAYVFAEVGANANLFGKTFTKSWEFIDELNSPIKIIKHWENDVLVDKCKYENISSGTTGSSLKKKVNYAEYSNYGTEFNGIITASTSADSKSDGSVTRWSGSITLSKDTEVYGDLFLTTYKTYEDGREVTKSFDYLDLDGHSLTVYGDIIQNRGTIKINNGRLNVYGDYIMQDVTINNIGETVYESCSARLVMENQYDKVNIDGNFTTHNLYGGGSGYVSLTRGILSIGGDIWSDKYISASSSYGHKTVLNGSGTQKVYMLNGNLNELEVTKPSTHTIVFGGDLKVYKFVSDVNIKPDDLNLYYFDLNKQNVTINGNVTIGNNSNTLDLNGGILTIKGNILQSNGTIKCNNGTLNVTGNYTMEKTTTNNIGETVYESCSARLVMENQYDKVNIDGNFTTHNLYGGGSGYVSLTRGILSIGGDIWSDKYISASSSYGHKTILTGDKKQSVTLNESNKFNILVLTQNKSNYTFSPEPCWNSLITIVSGSGDINIDNDITIADVVLLQKYLVRKEFFNKAEWKLADLNSDGTVNVFDVIILKRRIFYS